METVKVRPQEKYDHVRIIEVTSAVEGDAMAMTSKHWSSLLMPTGHAIEAAVQMHWSEYGRMRSARYRDAT